MSKFVRLFGVMFICSFAACGGEVDEIDVTAVQAQESGMRMICDNIANVCKVCRYPSGNTYCNISNCPESPGWWCD